MSTGMKIQGAKKQPQQMVSQSIPVQWYANYKPPAAPKIRPSHAPPPNKLPAFGLPPSSPDVGGVAQLKSFSLTNDAHPMSMPVRRMQMDAIQQKIAQAKKQQEQNSNTLRIDEAKENTADSLTADMGNLEVGSFTCFQLMTDDKMKGRAPLQPMAHTDDDAHTNVSETPSTVQTQTSRQDEEDDDGAFDMDDDESDE